MLNKLVLILLTVTMAGEVLADFVSPPKDAIKALKVTKSKKRFDKGLVFVNGKFVPGPYEVERYGNVVRINRRQVTGEIVLWSEFLKTQDNVNENRSVELVKAEVPKPKPKIKKRVSTKSKSKIDSELDALFDEDTPGCRPVVEDPPIEVEQEEESPVEEKTETAESGVAAVPSGMVEKVTVTYELDGEFVPNEKTAAMIKAVNTVRTEIETFLRKGGCICFGEKYPCVSIDERAARKLIDALPEILQRSQTLDQFKAGARSAGLVYLTDAICEELFANRIDYRKMQEFREKRKNRTDYDDVSKFVPKPIF